MSSAFFRRAHGRIGLARLARWGHNPYLSLLEENLAACGFTIVSDPPFTLRWLWKSRREVTFLHFHWRPDRYYIWRRHRWWRRQQPRKRRPPPRFQGPLTWLTLVSFAVRLLASRGLGYRVVWTIHEVYPPETGTRQPGSVSRSVDRLAERLLARRSSLLLAHDQATAEKARDELGLPAMRVEILPHGSYIGVYPAGRSREEVRMQLRIPEESFVFLSFGALRPEKETSFLLSAFQALELSDVALVVAGVPEHPASAFSAIRAFRADVRVLPILGRVPSARVAELFGAADAAVVPRSTPWTSGSLILALSLGVPVVAARLPPYEELLAGEQAGWLFRPGDADSLREALQRAAGNRAAARAKGVAARRQAENLPSWQEIARRTTSLMLAAGAGQLTSPIPSTVTDTLT